jgi:hypothetical protein
MSSHNISIVANRCKWQAADGHGLAGRRCEAPGAHDVALSKVTRL